MATLHIAPNHPAGAGHFPGNPVIPGAWLLAEVVREIAKATGRNLDAAAIKSAKFQHTVRPGDCVEIEYAISGRQEIRFQCTVAGTKVLAGVMNATAGE